MNRSWVFEMLDGLGGNLCDRFLRLLTEIDPRIKLPAEMDETSELQ
jgi:hypothetical protein